MIFWKKSQFLGIISDNKKVFLGQKYALFHKV